MACARERPERGSPRSRPAEEALDDPGGELRAGVQIQLLEDLPEVGCYGMLGDN
jgi:hypothetical protein